MMYVHCTGLSNTKRHERHKSALIEWICGGLRRLHWDSFVLDNPVCMPLQIKTLFQQISIYFSPDLHTQLLKESIVAPSTKRNARWTGILRVQLTPVYVPTITRFTRGAGPALAAFYRACTYTSTGYNPLIALAGWSLAPSLATTMPSVTATISKLPGYRSAPSHEGILW